MSAIKIIFFDIDGTLLDPATERISPKTKEALALLKEKGILRCVATGRPKVSLPDFSDIGFDALLVFNGAYCYTGDELICEAPIDQADLMQLMANANKLGRPVAVALRDDLAANGWDPDLSEYYRSAGLVLEPAENFDQRLQEPVYKFMLAGQEKDYPAILEGTKNVKMAISWERAADVVSASGGKGAAIGKVLAQFGLEPKDAMAFGDHYNDLEMMKAVGTGVAMGNATEALKAVADDVCGPVSEDGIYHYCRKIGLI